MYYTLENTRSPILTKCFPVYSFHFKVIIISRITEHLVKFKKQGERSGTQDMRETLKRAGEGKTEIPFNG